MPALKKLAPICCIATSNAAPAHLGISMERLPFYVLTFFWGASLMLLLWAYWEDIKSRWLKMRGKKPAVGTAGNTGDWEIIQYWPEHENHLEAFVGSLDFSRSQRYPRLIRVGNDIREVPHPKTGHWSNSENSENNSKKA